MMSRFHGFYPTGKIKPSFGKPPNEGVTTIKNALIMVVKCIVNKKNNKISEHLFQLKVIRL